MVKVLAVAGVVLVVLAGVAAVFIVLSPGTETDPPPAPVTPETTLPALLVRGTVILKVTPDSVDLGDHPDCYGKGDFADVNLGAQIVVTDAAAKTIALGRLDDGMHQERGCVFEFSMAVPAGHEFYGVEIAHQGRQQYTAAQMNEPIEVTFGK
ncbi:unnamed protein product [[Actinomadura] parvosata subsp. kistnae]|uniref:Uncharacterized protein n=1 Tax=[Actinomadura] parvosata subsp. kistnae TaxID=1909395 RepID=A0A1V0ABN9_9ACTN|nr:hypothetical protein [Nonomuraea sp. ATCC 55076]AQZ67625.1 hypothetical protein BKM31_44705 [Nonomuraea sp. ATCC 55076]SPL94090.1 unnamed protein product [Actinomadura parvosata subsp. kistnae]